MIYRFWVICRREEQDLLNPSDRYSCACRTVHGQTFPLSHSLNYTHESWVKSGEKKEGLREKLQSCQRTVSSQFSTRLASLKCWVFGSWTVSKIVWCSPPSSRVRESVSVSVQGSDKNFFDVISVMRLKSVWVSFSGHRFPQVSHVGLSWSAWTPGICSPPWIYGKLATGNLSLNHDQRSLLVSSIHVLLSIHASLSHMHNNHPVSVQPVGLFSLSLWYPAFFFYLCWWQSFQLQSSITFQTPLPVKVEGGWKAALPCLWVDTWLNGMCTAGKMILLQTVVWIREVSLTPPTQKQ